MTSHSPEIYSCCLAIGFSFISYPGHLLLWGRGGGYTTPWGKKNQHILNLTDRIVWGFRMCESACMFVCVCVCVCVVKLFSHVRVYVDVLNIYYKLLNGCVFFLFNGLSTFMDYLKPKRISHYTTRHPNS